jgi:hypothetical protein
MRLYCGDPPLAFGSVAGGRLRTKEIQPILITVNHFTIRLAAASVADVVYSLTAGASDKG